ncbi:DUF3168 domain-containing protein [Aliishimia ponticola]|uniref:DUF3168 domain-containing protein n=1 Tax=Aliishimia ponticola TaxID=2499833 RepID=A0A4S4NQ31_9RHOB|nr:DUF3168 domain-containing protein [Aliishimia ponticola]THH38310.1 DUF3168 domain-containing protein [Aliishimia ponticola]
MSYALSAALQSAVYQKLIGDAALSGLVGADIYDTLPSGLAPRLYVSLGPETAKDASDYTSHGALHRFTISVIADEAGFSAAKTVAAAVCDALVDADLTMSRGRLVALGFERATAKRDDGDSARRIDLQFRARVEDS